MTPLRAVEHVTGTSGAPGNPGCACGADGPASDEALIAAVADGDHAAFGQLYQRYQGRILGYVRRFVADRMAAEEVLVDVMTAVWLRARDFRGGSRPSTWILGIARHKAIDAGRRRTAREGVARVPDALGDAAASLVPFDEVSTAQLTHATSQALRQLSDDQQEVVRLAFYEELPYAEIAVRIGVPTNTVKTRVFHAKRQLRRHLAGLEIERLA